MRSLHPTLRTLMLALAAVVLLWQRPVQGQSEKNESPRRVPDGKLTVRVYEVTDLVVIVPDYPYSQANERPLGYAGRGPLAGGFGGGGMVMGGTGMSAPSPLGSPADAPLAGISMDDLMELITLVCSEDTWNEAGGDGKVASLGYSLVVSQTQAVHQQIQELLDQLREGSGKRKTVTVDARWLLLDSDDLEKLTAPNLEGKSQVDRKILAEYTRRPSSIRALTSCFTGQLVYVVSGTRQSIVTSVIPVVGSAGQPEEFGARFAARGTPEGRFMFVSRPQGLGGFEEPRMAASRDRSVGYQPVVEKPNFGALLEIRPTLVPDENFAIVDLRSTITVPGKPMGDLAALTPQPRDVPQVDRIAIDTLELATTLSIPLGQPVLVGGLTYVTSSILGQSPAEGAASPPAQATIQESPQLYLILELRLGAGF